MVQTVSYTLGASILLIYVYAGTIPAYVPIVYFCVGVTIIGLFVLLSETHFNDRFEDHFLTIHQIASQIAVQLAFLIIAPKIGYAFLGVMFLIFSYGALRMTSRQATIAWLLTTLGLTPIFLFTRLPLSMPVDTDLERLAALLSFVATVGQCAFVGLYGSSLRKQLRKNSIELQLAYSRIEELAELDELTGTYNRRCIMRMLGDEIIRAQRLNHPCSVALIDLDWFKRINDTFGHPTGDEVLRTFAITMFANIRTIDRFGRYGGEEFLLLLPETAEDAAMRMLDRLRLIVSDLDWSAFSQGMMVTISAGVATLEANETPDSLLARADSALYAAKGGGRNRIAAA